MEIEGIKVKAINVPCHTKGHLLYYVKDYSGQQSQCNLDISSDQQNDSYSEVLFTGDTLFSSGCGRFFEGSAEQMQSNFDKLNSLPDST